MNGAADIEALRAEIIDIRSRLAAAEAVFAVLSPPQGVIAAAIRATADQFGIIEPVLIGQQKGRRLMPARFAAYWVATQVSSLSTNAIAWRMGNRHPMTITGGVAKAEEWRAADAAYRAATDAIRARVLMVDARA